MKTYKGYSVGQSIWYINKDMTRAMMGIISRFIAEPETNTFLFKIKGLKEPQPLWNIYPEREPAEDFLKMPAW